MHHASIKNTALSTLLIFLGLVSRDLNAHHQVVSLNSAPQKTPSLSAVVTDLFYAEPTLIFKKVK